MTIAASVLAGRYGRRPVIVAGVVARDVWAFPYFALVESGSIAALVSLVATPALRSPHQPAAVVGPAASSAPAANA